MCGINLLVWKDKSCDFCQRLFGHEHDHLESNVDNDGNDHVLEFCDDNLRRRGPDAQRNISTVTHPGYHRIQCAASVLQMRAELLEQPVSFVPAWTKSKDSSTANNTEGSKNYDEQQQQNKEEQGAYLCWNGEIYQQLPSSSSQQSKDVVDKEEAFMYDVADTTIVVNHLQSPISIDSNAIASFEDLGVDNLEPCARTSPTSVSPEQHHIANVMARFYNAEFAFCVLTQNGVYYGRDRWGRRSLLLWRCPRNCGSFQLVSVAEELPLSIVSSSLSEATPTATKTPGESPLECKTTVAQEWIEVPPGTVHSISFSQSAEKNVAVFYPKASFSLPRLPKDFPLPPIPNRNSDTTQTPPLATAAISNRLWKASLELEFHLRRAVTMRLDQSSRRRSTGVLFSGGVDSVVLAALAADILSSRYRVEKQETKLEHETKSEPESKTGESLSMKKLTVPILHLYNVSFGPNPEKSADRKAALKSYQTLREKYQNSSNRYNCQADDNKDYNGGNDIIDSDEADDEDCDIKIAFRDIVVEWEDICRTESHIRTLLSPKHTVMDVNIATALWFASRGTAAQRTIETNYKEGYKDSNNNDGNNDRSPRVLLLGMGADELMGGYGRHRKAYEKGGWEELQKELTMDQNRLWERNCGRDDRLCSDHGREARFPFLDAHVVRFLQEGMASEDGLVCDFTLPPGVGDKQILRLVAERLGLEHASGLVKRAIQFGSRISHLSDTKRFGSRRKAKGAMKI